MRTRFAPSPTGHLHLGHVYAAKFAFELAQQQQGEFLLRFEDIDTTRVRQPYYSAIEDDLTFLKMPWHHSAIRQTDRLDHYQSALQQLIDQQLVYPCFCSRKEIERELQHLQHAPHGPEGPHYPGTCRQLTPDDVSSRLDNGEIPSWRLDAQTASNRFENLRFHDTLLGDIALNPSLLGDTILARKDIGTSYHIAVVVDDAFQKITDVTRGSDLLHATHIHRILQQALDLPCPHYHHHQLLTDSSGKRLAKRHASLSIKYLREQGHTAEQILAMVDSTPRS